MLIKIHVNYFQRQKKNPFKIIFIILCLRTDKIFYFAARKSQKLLQILVKIVIKPDMALSDENSGMMDGLCKTKFKHLGLETSLEEVLKAQTQNVIELHLVLIQHTDSD